MKTVNACKLETLRMVVGGEKRHPVVIIENEVWRWVGFGWVSEGKPTTQQIRKLPHAQK